MKASLLAGLFATSCATTIRFEHQLQVRRPAAEVFAFVANPENLPRWNYYVTDVRQTSPGARAVGSRFHQTRKTDAQDLEISEWREEAVVAFKTLPPERALTMRFTVKPEGDHTVLTDHWDLEAGSALGALVAGPTVKAAVWVNLGHLRELLETGKTTLPDGRVSTWP